MAKSILCSGAEGSHPTPLPSAHGSWPLLGSTRRRAHRPAACCPGPRTPHDAFWEEEAQFRAYTTHPTWGGMGEHTQHTPVLCMLPHGPPRQVQDISSYPPPLVCTASCRSAWQRTLSEDTVCLSCAPAPAPAPIRKPIVGPRTGPPTRSTAAPAFASAARSNPCGHQRRALNHAT